MAHHRTWNNGKVRRFAEAISEPLAHAVGHLESLWHDAYENHLPYGRYREDEVEQAARWDGPCGEFVAGARKVGLLKVRRGWLYINDFEENAPEYVKKRIRRALEKAPRRATAPRGSHPAPNGSSTQPNPTQPNIPPISPSELEARTGGTGPPPVARRDPITESRLRAWNTKCLEDLKAGGRSGILALSDKHLWELMKRAGGVEVVEKLSSHLYWRAWRGFQDRKPEDKKYPWHTMWILRRIEENGAADEKDRAREQADQVRQKLEADKQQIDQANRQEEEEMLVRFRKLPKDTCDPWILKAKSGAFAPRKLELIERMAAMLWQQKGK